MRLPEWRPRALVCVSVRVHWSLACSVSRLTLALTRGSSFDLNKAVRWELFTPYVTEGETEIRYLVQSQMTRTWQSQDLNLNNPGKAWATFGRRGAVFSKFSPGSSLTSIGIFLLWGAGEDGCLSDLLPAKGNPVPLALLPSSTVEIPHLESVYSLLGRWVFLEGLCGRS